MIIDKEHQPPNTAGGVSRVIRFAAALTIFTLAGCELPSNSAPPAATDTAVANTPVTLLVPAIDTPIDTPTNMATNTPIHITTGTPVSLPVPSSTSIPTSYLTPSPGLGSSGGLTVEFLNDFIAFGMVKVGASAAVTLTVDDADSVTFALLAMGTGTKDGPVVTLSVRDPNGKMVRFDNSTQEGYCVPMMMGYTCAVQKPTPGQWQAIAEARQGSAPSATDVPFSVQTQFTGGVQITEELATTGAAVGKPVAVKATLRDPAPVAGATIYASSLLMTGMSGVPAGGSAVTSTIAMAEQAPGVFTGEFTPTMEGDYSIAIYAKGRNNKGHPFARQSTSDLHLGALRP
jgi:hypothetical protein